MGILTPPRYQIRIAITFCIITIINTGCATFQIVDTALLEQNKSKTFKLGMVKAAGEPKFGIFGGPPKIEDKKKALENIPIAEICAILSSKYAITIDSSVDKTVNLVVETLAPDVNSVLSDKEKEKLLFTVDRDIENAYYGNVKYEESGRTPGVYVNRFSVSSHVTFVNNPARPQIINAKEFPDVVNMTYSVVHGAIKEAYLYEIYIVSSKKVIVQIRGVVASLALDNSETIGTFYVEHAGRIGEALKKDLSDPRNTYDVNQGVN